jgi:hypothetical protein
MATFSGSKAERPVAIVSAFTKVDILNRSRKRKGASVVACSVRPGNNYHLPLFVSHLKSTGSRSKKHAAQV